MMSDRHQQEVRVTGRHKKYIIFFYLILFILFRLILIFCSLSNPALYFPQLYSTLSYSPLSFFCLFLFQHHFILLLSLFQFFPFFRMFFVFASSTFISPVGVFHFASLILFTRSNSHLNKGKTGF
jgi:hypothetical protein